MEKRTKVALGCVAAGAGACVLGCAGLYVLGLAGQAVDDRTAAAAPVGEVVADEEPKAEPAEVSVEAEPEEPVPAAVPEEPPPGEWYEGGTLHQATVAEWRAAAPENRLATAADFTVTGMRRRGHQPANMTEVFVEAFGLRTCIDTAVAEGHADNQDVSSIAATCMVLMEAEE